MELVIGIGAHGTNLSAGVQSLSRKILSQAKTTLVKSWTRTQVLIIRLGFYSHQNWASYHRHGFSLDQYKGDWIYLYLLAI